LLDWLCKNTSGVPQDIVYLKRSFAVKSQPRRGYRQSVQSLSVQNITQETTRCRIAMVNPTTRLLESTRMISLPRFFNASPLSPQTPLCITRVINPEQFTIAGSVSYIGSPHLKLPSAASHSSKIPHLAERLFLNRKPEEVEP